MLLGFGAKNFFSFKEGIEISLELGANCPETVSRGNTVANLLCVKGGNGSGKTNVLKILSFLQYHCCHSFSRLKPDDEIMVSPFFYNNDPIEIFCEFLINNIRYTYELSLTNKTILSEKLSRRINRYTLLFERKGENLSYCINEFSALNGIKLRKNASILSVAHQYEIDCISSSYQFFESIISNVAWHGRVNLSQEFKYSSKFYVEHPDIFKSAVKLIKESDLGISDIKIQETSDENGDKFYYPIFKHDVEDITNNWLPYVSQSLGTKTLYNTIFYYIVALEKGGILVADEFDIDFHPNLLPKFVSYFDNEKFNKNNAQMIFSTHNTYILEYLGKYRTVLINKTLSESFGYRLDELPGDLIRNDRPIVPLYNSGKIGGVPKL